MSPVGASSWEICRLFSSCRRHLDQEVNQSLHENRERPRASSILKTNFPLTYLTANYNNLTALRRTPPFRKRSQEKKLSAGRGGTSTQSRHQLLTSVQTPWVKTSAGQKTRRQENDRKILHVMAAMLVILTTQNFAGFV